jgi:hypothetical protein
MITAFKCTAGKCDVEYAIGEGAVFTKVAGDGTCYGDTFANADTTAENLLRHLETQGLVSILSQTALD